MDEEILLESLRELKSKNVKNMERADEEGNELKLRFFIGKDIAYCNAIEAVYDVLELESLK